MVVSRKPNKQDAENPPIAFQLYSYVLGGGSLIRGLDTLLSHETNLPIHVDEDPLTCVVRGTGRILDDEERYWSVLTS